MIELLLTLLGGTILYTTCPTNPTRYGYYNPPVNEVVICLGHPDTVGTIYHEIGHMYRYKVLGRDYSNPPVAEKFADDFSYMMLNHTDIALKVLFKK